MSMENFKFQMIKYCFFLTVCVIALISCNSKNETGKKVIIAYIYANDTILNENSVDVQKITHINFAFANIVDGKIAEGGKTDSVNFSILSRLKHKNPDLKVLISVGGWSWSGNFSEMATGIENRNKFIESAIAFVKKYQLDGIDIDWEYPGLPGDENPFKPEDKENFTSLMQELRQSLTTLGKETGTNYLLTFAAGAFADYVKHIEASKVVGFVDYINLMTYDFCGEWDTVTGFHTNLYAPKNGSNANSAQKTVELFTSAGVPAQKLVLGIAFYGHGWRDVSSINNGQGQKGKGYNPGYSFKSITANYLGKNGYNRYFDSTAKAPFIYNPDSLIFITYEDPESIGYKCEYLKKADLAGAMFWELMDDYKGQLLDAVYKGLE